MAVEQKINQSIKINHTYADFKKYFENSKHPEMNFEYFLNNSYAVSKTNKKDALHIFLEDFQIIEIPALPKKEFKARFKPGHKIVWLSYVDDEDASLISPKKCYLDSLAIVPEKNVDDFYKDMTYEEYLNSCFEEAGKKYPEILCVIGFDK